MSYGELGMPLGRQVTLPSVDARGRTWNTRLRRPVLYPLSYVGRVQRGSGAVRTPGAHWAYPGSSRAQALLVAAPTRFELAVFAVTGRRGLHSLRGRDWYASR